MQHFEFEQNSTVAKCLKYLSEPGMAIWIPGYKSLQGHLPEEDFNEYMNKFHQKIWTCIYRSKTNEEVLYLDYDKMETFLDLVAQESRVEFPLTFTEVDSFRKMCRLDIVDIDSEFVTVRCSPFSHTPCSYLVEDGLAEKVEDNVYRYKPGGVKATFREDSESLFPQYPPIRFQDRCDKMAGLLRQLISEAVKPIDSKNVQASCQDDGRISIIWPNDFSKTERKHVVLLARELFKEWGATFNSRTKAYQITNVSHVYIQMWARNHLRKPLGVAV